MSAISDLEAKVQSLTDQLRAAEESLRNAKLEISPVKKGTIVLWKGARWRVTSVGVSDWTPSKQFGRWNRPEIWGNKQLKNGGWGETSWEIYGDWELEPSREAQALKT